MQCFDFCGDWKFAKGDREDARAPEFDDAAWESVAVPHTWNADDMAPGMPMAEAHVGPAWYRKRFRAERPADGGRSFLLFEAVALRSKVWVDGAYVGGREGGFLSFRLDITDALVDGAEHVVAVWADNSFQFGSVPPASTDWERYGGMYRRVWLVEKGPAVFDHKSIQVRTPEVSAERGVVTVSARVLECESRDRRVTVRHRLIDPDGGELSVVEESLGARCGRTVASDLMFPDVASPRLWSPDSPALYRVESSLWDGDRELDRETNPLGFRWFEFHPDRGFSINGQSMKLQGACIHQDFPGLGPATPDRFHRMDMEQMKAAGMNYMRTSHYPRNERCLDACDELGIMVTEEQPFWHGSLRSDHGEELERTARRAMREMVEHHGNHPCIISWNTVNEVMLTPPMTWHPDPDQRSKREQLRREEWPYALRLIGAMDDALHRADPSRPTSMIVGGWWRANEEAGTTRLTDMVGYNGGSINFDVDGEPIIDYLKQRDPGRVSVMTEGVVNAPGTLKARALWDEELTRWETYAEMWSRFYERDWFCGGAMWGFADYSAKGEYRAMGIVDYARVPYEGFWFFQSQWTEELMAHILCHWDWEEAAGTTRTVTVFTNGETAELFLNGESLGERRPDRERWPRLPHPPIQWEVPFQAGELRALARRDGAEAVDTRVTSAEPAGVELSVEPARIAADGRDACFVTATIVDAEGHRCYDANRAIDIEVKGVGRLAGGATIEIRGGVGRFAVRSAGGAGDIEVQASASGLAAATRTIPAE